MKDNRAARYTITDLSDNDCDDHMTSSGKHLTLGTTSFRHFCADLESVGKARGGLAYLLPVL